MNFNEFINKYQKVSVEQYHNSVYKKPVVSVCVQTFQHANYIRQCLDGILMQETDFSFEILLGDDASTDGTREICLDYANKYPDKIRLFLHHRANNISIGGTPTGRFNFIYNLFSARGKYIALCEGDDYWMDPLKLQKQVDLLENNTNFNICYHNAAVWIDGKITQKLIYENNNPRQLDFVDLLQGSYTKTCCSLVRMNKGFKNKIQKIPVLQLQDTTFFMAALEDGARAIYINEVMAVYRRHQGGVWGLLSAQKRLESSHKIYSFLKIRYKKLEHQLIIKKELRKTSLTICFINIKTGEWANAYLWYKQFLSTDGRISLKELYTLLRSYFLNKKIFTISLNK